MSHKSKKPLKRQISDALEAMFIPGRSKHADKKSGDKDALLSHIYSGNTLDAYKKHCYAFCDFVLQNTRCRELQAAAAYVDAYMMSRLEAGDSAYTLKLRKAALVKLYQNPDICKVKLPQRRHEDITRSRRATEGDKHFSEKNNADLVAFCRSTGMRRHEVEAARGSDLRVYEDGVFFYVPSGKNGKSRLLPVVGDVENVIALCRKAGENRLFEAVNPHADIHGYRREYAQTVYDMNARDVKTLPKKERYCCRGDKAGVWYDRAALGRVSKALGHNRLSVAAEHYLD